jgi:asparagine synthase (glutamine-hydrolysing)
MVKCAGLLARSCGWDWEVCRLDPPCGRHALQLLRIKSGIEHFGMSYILDFFEKIRQKHGGSIIHFTGDGGDRILPDLSSTKRFRSVRDVADAVLDVFRIGSSFKTAAALTQSDPTEIKKELVALLAGYPERDLAQKFIHFAIYENAIK